MNQDSVNKFLNGGDSGKVTVTTNSITFFDSNSVMLKIGFLDESMSIMMCAPLVDDSGKKSYPKETRETLFFRAEVISALYNMIVTKVTSAVENGVNYDGGVFNSMKKDNILQVEVLNGTISLNMFREIDSDRNPKRMIKFTFEKVPVIEKFAPGGDGFEIRDTDARFYLFTKTLAGYLEMVNGITTHAHRYYNRFTTNKIFKDLEAIMTKLGIAPVQNNYSNESNSGFNRESSAPVPQMQEVTDLSKLIG